MAADIKKHIEKDIRNSSPEDIRTIKAKGKFFIPFMLMLPALIFFTLFTIIPLIIVILDSLDNANSNYSSTFAVVWTDGDWYIAILNSLIYAIISVPTTLAVALIISFTLSNIIRKKFREFWQTIFFIPYVTSTVAISIVFSELFSSQPYGIINWILGVQVPWLETPYDDAPMAIFPVLIFGIWHSLAFKVLILTSSMLAIDKRLYDAAAIDGASSKDMFFNVTVPALNKTIWYLITIGLIGSMKVFPMALFGNSSSQTMDKFPTMLAYVYNCVKIADYGRAGASSLSLIVVVVFFNIIIRKGMSAIEGYFGNKKENQVKKEIHDLEIQRKRSIKYDEEVTKEMIINIDDHISANGGGK